MIIPQQCGSPFHFRDNSPAHRLLQVFYLTQGNYFVRSQVQQVDLELLHQAIIFFLCVLRDRCGE